MFKRRSNIHNLRRQSNNTSKRKLSGFTETLKSIHGKPDMSLLIIVLLFLVAGTIMNFSASNYYGYQHFGDVFYYTKKHIIWIFVGLFAMYLTYVMPLELLKKYSGVLFVGSCFLLLYILPQALFGNTIMNQDGSITSTGLQMPLVVQLNGATRWIEVPGLSTLQPSELAKFALMIHLAKWFTKNNPDDYKDAQTYREKIVLPFLLILGAITVLVLAQRDFGSMAVIGISAMIIFFTAGSSKLHSKTAVMIILSSFFAGFLALFLEGYRRVRFDTWFDLFRYGQPQSLTSARDEAFQSFHSLIAMGSGGLTGTGYNESVVKQGYLQEAAYTDSIFAIIGEEIGFLGTLLIIVGFFYFCVRGFKIAQNSSDKFNALLAIGMTSAIGVLAYMNMAAVLVIIPFSGMPLPFFTYGGTTTIITLASVGLLLNVSKYVKNK